MSYDKLLDAKHKSTIPKPSHEANQSAAQVPSMLGQMGNQAVQRMLAQRKGNDAPFELNEETADQINQHRGGGQALDSGVQAKLSGAMGYDFGQVKVHTSPEAHALNQQVGAKAFTTGNDVFFSQGAYSPQTNSGQELIAHELTHVVQQSAGNVGGGGGGGMTVNAPNDRYEQEADSVAQAVVSGGAEVQTQAGAAGVQRQEVKPEDEEKVQMKADPAVQREAVPEEEEEVQMKADLTVQRVEEDEDELS